MLTLLLKHSQIYYQHTEDDDEPEDGNVKNDIVQNFIKNRNLLKSLMVQLNADADSQLVNLKLINALLTHSSQNQAVMRILDSFGIRRTVARMTGLAEKAGFLSVLAEFQTHIVRDYQKGMSIPVVGDISTHVNALNEILDLVGFETSAEYKWRGIGFKSENPFDEFSEVGVLGLATIHYYVKKNVDECRGVLAY